MKSLFLIFTLVICSCDGCINVDVDGEIDHKVYVYPCLGEEDAGEDADAPTCVTPEDFKNEYF